MASNIARTVLSCSATFALLACGGGGSEETPDKPDLGTDAKALADRAYIVSLESDELTVIDLNKLEIIARVPTGGVENHMAELNADNTEVFIDSAASDETVVVDTRSFELTDRIQTGRHPAHLSFEPNRGLFAVMLEGEDSVAFLDPQRHEVVKKVAGMHVPHFMRFTRDGKWGYVANAGADHLTRVRMDTLEVDGEIAIDPFELDKDAGDEEDGESGFFDAQIDHTGTLYAAHKASGRVLVYDTTSNQKLTELGVGRRPWVVFAEHPFADVALRHLVPNFGDQTVSLIDGSVARRAVVMATLEGDEEAYGVNFSPLAPNTAFVMNRARSDVAVVDTDGGEIIERIEVGGNTETASTTADGKYVVATVSNANRVVVIDAQSRRIVKAFENVGKYPWSVTIPGGQNYCH
jgi:DNA-binding beta-propeller fold protein YncE